MEYIAQHISDNIRQMEGAIIKISVNANLMNAPIDLNLAKTVLEDLQKDHADGSSLENGFGEGQINGSVQEHTSEPQSDVCS